MEGYLSYLSPGLLRATLSGRCSDLRRFCGSLRRGLWRRLDHSGDGVLGCQGRLRGRHFEHVRLFLRGGYLGGFFWRFGCLWVDSSCLVFYSVERGNCARLGYERLRDFLLRGDGGYFSLGHAMAMDDRGLTRG